MPKSQEGIFLPILGIFLILIITVGAYYYLDTRNNSIKTNPPISPSPTATTYIKQAFPTTTAKIETKEFKIRYFDPSDSFFEDEPYPTEFTDIEDGVLRSMYCTNLYSGYDKDFTTYDEKTKQTKPLTDPKVAKYIQLLDKKYNGEQESYVTEILTCSTQEDETIILYSLGPCGGGCSGIPHVGIDEGSDIREVSNVSEGMAYFGCRKPLQLTKGNVFYFECGGGDGAGASKSIYKLMLSNFSITRVKNCLRGIDESGKSYSKCE